MLQYYIRKYFSTSIILKKLHKTCHWGPYKCRPRLRRNFSPYYHIGNTMKATNESTNRRYTDRNRKEPEEDKATTIIFPAFDVSIKKVGFGNSPNRIKTIAYEENCHSDSASFIKILLTRASISNRLSFTNRTYISSPINWFR